MIIGGVYVVFLAQVFSIQHLNITLSFFAWVMQKIIDTEEKEEKKDKNEIW